MAYTVYKMDELCTIRGKKVAEKKVAANTVLRRLDDGSFAVRYVDTDVLTFHPDFTITFRAGGWYTPTTMRRIEEYGDGAPGFRISNRGADGWYLQVLNNDYSVRASHPFREGMRLNGLSGELVDAGLDWGDFQEYNKLAEKWIAKLVKQIDAVNIHEDMRVQYENCMDGDVIKGVLTLELIEDCYRIYWNGAQNGHGDPMWLVRWDYEVAPLTQGYGRRGYRDIADIKATVRSALRMRYLRGPLGIRKNMGVPRPLPPTYEKVAQPE